MSARSEKHHLGTFNGAKTITIEARNGYKKLSITNDSTSSGNITVVGSSTKIGDTTADTDFTIAVGESYTFGTGQGDIEAMVITIPAGCIARIAGSVFLQI